MTIRSWEMAQTVDQTIELLQAVKVTVERADPNYAPSDTRALLDLAKRNVDAMVEGWTETDLMGAAGRAQGYVKKKKES